jgi:hypothetical protein
VSIALTRADLPNDPEVLRSRVLTQALELETLRFQIAVLRRQKYGRSSEQADRELLQMPLRLEDLEAQFAARPAHMLPPVKAPAVKPVRRPLPDHLPRESIVHESACPDCGGAQLLEGSIDPERVVRHLKPSDGLAGCDKAHQLRIRNRTTQLMTPLHHIMPIIVDSRMKSTDLSLPLRNKGGSCDRKKQQITPCQRQAA